MEKHLEVAEIANHPDRDKGWQGNDLENHWHGQKCHQQANWNRCLAQDDDDPKTTNCDGCLDDPTWDDLVVVHEQRSLNSCLCVFACFKVRKYTKSPKEGENEPQKRGKNPTRMCDETCQTSNTHQNQRWKSNHDNDNGNDDNNDKNNKQQQERVMILMGRNKIRQGQETPTMVFEMARTTCLVNLPFSVCAAHDCYSWSFSRNDWSRSNKSEDYLPCYIVLCCSLSVPHPRQRRILGVGVSVYSTVLYTIQWCWEYPHDSQR